MLQNNRTKQKARVGRKSNSCTECNRRKVKCDGKVPCNQCLKRRKTQTCKLMSSIDPHQNSDPVNYEPTTFEDTPSSFNQGYINSRSSSSIDTTLPSSDRHHTGSPTFSLQSIRDKEILPLFFRSRSDEDIGISLANLARAFSAFEIGWNWMYEVVSDSNFQRCFDVLDPACQSFSSESNSQHAQLVLAISIIFAGIHVGEDYLACSIFPSYCQEQIQQNKYERWRQHDRDICKRKSFDTLERLMITLTRKVVATEGITVCLLQAIFIHHVCCYSEGRKSANLSSDINFTMYDAIEKCCKFHEKEGVDFIPEDEKRLYWSILSMDNMGTLKMFDLPKMKRLPNSTNFLPEMIIQQDCKRYKVRRYALNWIRAKICIATSEITKAIGEWQTLKKQTPYSTVQGASRQIELCKLQLPSILRIKDDNTTNVTANVRDSHLVRLRYLIAIVIDKAIECVHRIALTEMIICSIHAKRQESCQEAIEAARRCIGHFTQLRILSKNAGDTHCIWHMNMPTSILTLSVACIWQTDISCSLQQRIISPCSIKAMQAISNAIELLEATSEKEIKWLSLRVLARLKTQLHSLIFCDGVGLEGDERRHIVQISNSQTYILPQLSVFGLQGTFTFIKSVRQKLQKYNNSHRLVNDDSLFRQNINGEPVPIIHSSIDNLVSDDSQLGIVEWLDQFFKEAGYMTESETQSNGINSEETISNNNSFTQPNTIVAEEEDPILYQLLSHNV